MHTSSSRPIKPADLNTSTSQAFQLTSMAETLMSEAALTPSGRAALTLARGDELTVVLTVLKAGHKLGEHPAPAAAVVTCLGGNISFKTDAENITLEQGEAVVFTADILHSVYANEDSVFLIVIGGAKAKHRQDNH